ncbi:biotin transporter BioY [Filobacillus milosensis]|uniref:Biotin transporter n=1 Tax=Filobacillus milosensis TaxID=94137 RepID=A0A4Y8IV94_9BACI|nr:biotin transporter BioY [Filobacillus milosensis]TFB24238.1 biotin transporter BioY [Filobacillus milosensis]
MNNLSFKLAFAAIFVVLMAIGANIATWFPLLKVSGVPLTLQTFFAILAGLLLGKKLGAFSMVAYLAVGAVGIPVFADLSAGVIHFIRPTGGFLISFVFVAFFVGLIVEKSEESIKTYLIATFVGLMTNYLIGTPFMYLSLNYVMETSMSLVTAFQIMIPFFIKDFIITMAAAVVLPQFITRLTKAVPSLATTRS